MSRVFVVNEPVIYRDGQPFRHLDLSDAERFGSILHLTPPGSALIDHQTTADGMVRGLADFTPDDYLLAIGNPAMIAWAAAIAARNCSGRLRVLMWRGRGDDGRYHPTEVTLWTDERRAA
jgi:hypothetical protein